MFNTQSIIPNPTKTINLPVSSDKVTVAITNLSETLKSMGKKGYNLTETDEFMNTYTFEKTEFLSLGSVIVMEVIDNGDKTQIKLEVQRKLGAFDNEVEVHNATEHITYITKALSTSLNPKATKTTKVTEKKKGMSTFKMVMIVMVLLSVVGAML